MRFFSNHRVLTVLLTLLSASPGIRALELPNCFSDHMVLQRDRPVAIYGKAPAGQTVTVTFRDQQKQTRVGEDGRWKLTLEPLEAGGPDELILRADEDRVFRDVWVGEVWLGSGQSNMQMYPGFKDIVGDTVLNERIQASYPELRLLRSDSEGWMPATPENLKEFSALLFSFGYRVQPEIGVPLGLMVGAVGGTPSGKWLTPDMLRADERCMEIIGENPRKAAEHDLEVDQVGELFEKHLRPWVGYTFRGVLWDQGESGVRIAGIHSPYHVMRALIHGWRNEFDNGEFPFVYIQKPSGAGCAWDDQNPVTRAARPFEAFTEEEWKNKPVLLNKKTDYIDLMEVRGAYMVSTSDLGAGGHPENKSGYGWRAGNVALNRVYGQEVPWIGPTYAGHTIEGDTIRIKFDHVGPGLAVPEGQKLQGFILSNGQGGRRGYRWAEAVIEGTDTVVLSHPDVKEPKVAGYALYPQHPWANLFSKNGLPAIPFQTE